jgi:hypothetical protein
MIDAKVAYYYAARDTAEAVAKAAYDDAIAAAEVSKADVKE